MEDGAHTEDGEAKWAATLDRYGLSPQELRSLVANQLEILRFLEFRVRPLVQVSRQEVDDYYTNTLAPQVKARGETPEPEDQVSAKIRELLEEQKMNAGDGEVDQYPALAEPGADPVGRGAVEQNGSSAHAAKDGREWGTRWVMWSAMR